MTSLGIVGTRDSALHVRAWGEERALAAISKTWAQIFKTWHEAIVGYCAHADDCALWYRQRPQVSFLSGAIWRAGGYSLQEFSQTKGRGHSHRTDVFAWIDGAGDFVAEAEFGWLELESKSLGKELRKHIRAAGKHLKKTGDGLVHQPDYLAALVFRTWTIKVDSTPKVEKAIKKLRKYDKPVGDFDVLFRADLRLDASKIDIVNGGYSHPGMTLFVGLNHGH